MKVIDVLQKPLIDACPVIHGFRMTALMTAVQAGINQQKVSVTGLGRSLKSLSDTNTKHDIKRMDRLVGNWHLHAERVALCAVMTRWLVGGAHHPVILVDWSSVEGQEIFQLLASCGTALQDTHANRRRLSGYEKSTVRGRIIASAFNHNRAIRQLIIDCRFGSVVLWCIGKIAVDRGHHSALQANTVRSQAVLSYCFIAIQIVDGPHYMIYAKDLASLINTINLNVKTLHNVL